MKVVYIYRCPQLGISIGKVFKPIQAKMNEYCECDEITFDNTNYNILAIIRNVIKVRKYMKKNKDAIIHITGIEHYILPFIRKYKTVCTVHDLGFYTNQKKTVRLLLKYPLWISSLRFAKRVIFISKKSLLEAERLIRFRENQTAVIMNPVSDEFDSKISDFNSECPNILIIGTKSNKNLERTIQALEGIKCNLRIIGTLTEEQKMLLKKHNIVYSQAEGITDRQVVKEYQNCDIVSFASQYEGFGMPIIEGQAAGKTVITSNISPMKEIANGSCVLVDPFNINSIREGILQAIKQHSYYEKAGKENVKRFSVDSKVREYYKIYKEIEKL